MQGMRALQRISGCFCCCCFLKETGSISAWLYLLHDLRKVRQRAERHMFYTAIRKHFVAETRRRLSMNYERRLRTSQHFNEKSMIETLAEPLFQNDKINLKMCQCVKKMKATPNLLQNTR